MTPPRETPTRNSKEARDKLRRMLVQKGLISADRLEEMEHRATWMNDPFDQLILRENIVPAKDIIELLSRITGIAVQSMGELKLDRTLAARTDAHVVARYRILPIREESGILTLATDRLRESEEEDHLRILLGAPLRWVFCTPEELTECIKHLYGVGMETFARLTSPAGAARRRSGSPEEVRESDMSPNLTDFIHQVIVDAIQSDATDIHFEPGETRFRIRYRMDGVLHDIPMPVGLDPMQKAVLSSLKVMAQLNIAERRLPQDGRFSVLAGGRTCDLRVSVLPSRHGESMVLRILNREATLLQLDQLGMNDDHRADLVSLLSQPHGMILFTGPTGSGKTTSLYGSLAHLNKEDRKIVTLEDPIEYQLPGIVQIQVQPEIGMTFASGLRSVLRHDPDVVLVGEIRDDETAGIAVSASLTGHLVFSTLHTNDSASAPSRLLDMGIEPYLVSSSLDGVVAQRLVRCICPLCREPVSTAAFADELRAIGFDQPGDLTFYRGRGCPHCRFSGYKGRRAIFEILLLNDELRALIAERATSARLLSRARELGLRTLRETGWDLVLEGATTAEELLRVTHRVRDSHPRPRRPPATAPK